jgi:hypothetical protein
MEPAPVESSLESGDPAALPAALPTTANAFSVAEPPGRVRVGPEPRVQLGYKDLVDAVGAGVDRDVVAKVIGYVCPVP